MSTCSYTYGLDRKCRLVCPSPFRAALGTPLVLTRAPEGTLLVLSGAQWQALERRYAGSLAFRGFYLAGAVECPVDVTTGRFLIPHVLRDYAGLKPYDEVVLCGIGKAVQVTRKDRWEAALRAGSFVGLEALDADLALPRDVETQPYSQTVTRPLGVPVVRCRGRLHARAVRRLAQTLAREAEAGPLAVVVDLREAGEREAAEPLAAGLGAVPVWWVAEERVGRAWFPTLEAAFLALPEGRG